MLQTKTRPFTDAERERLEADLIEATKEPTPDYGFVSGVAGICVFFGLVVGMSVYLILAFFEWSGLWASVIAGISTAFGFAYGYKRFRSSLDEWQKQTRKEHAATLAKRLGRSEIEETTVIASAVAVAMEPDEGDYSGYFFDIGDNRVLFLWDDALRDNEYDLQLSSAFTFTQFPGDGRDGIRLNATGQPLEPSRHLSFEQTGDDWSDTFYNGAVFENVSLATLETDLPYLMATPEEPSP